MYSIVASIKKKITSEIWLYHMDQIHLIYVYGRNTNKQKRLEGLF